MRRRKAAPHEGGGALAAALLLVAGAFVLQRGTGTETFAGCRSGVVAGGSGALGTEFTLTDENGDRVTDAQVFDKPSLLYMGYTFCPDVCPMDNARNAEAVTLLENCTPEEIATPIRQRFNARVVGELFTGAYAAAMLRAGRTAHEGDRS